MANNRYSYSLTEVRMPNLPSTNQRTDPEVELRVVSLIAVGRRYADISEETGVAVPTIKKIKRRNPQALAKMQTVIIERQAKVAARIHQKSLNEIDKKLDRAEAGSEDITIKDLVSVSKEMFSQSQIEQGKPTAITMNPHGDLGYLKTLTAALEADDAVAMAELLWPKEN